MLLLLAGRQERQLLVQHGRRDHVLAAWQGRVEHHHGGRLLLLLMLLLLEVVVVLVLVEVLVEVLVVVVLVLVLEGGLLDGGRGEDVLDAEG